MARILNYKVLKNHLKIFVYRDLDGYVLVYARNLEEADKLLKRKGVYTPATTYVNILAIPIQPNEDQDGRPANVKKS